ncbi:hypothetical protein HN011_012224, partial [Eciton burchellii]
SPPYPSVVRKLGSTSSISDDCPCLAFYSFRSGACIDSGPSKFKERMDTGQRKARPSGREKIAFNEVLVIPRSRVFGRRDEYHPSWTTETSSEMPDVAERRLHYTGNHSNLPRGVPHKNSQSSNM